MKLNMDFSVSSQREKLMVFKIDSKTYVAICSVDAVNEITENYEDFLHNKAEKRDHVI